MTKLRGNRVFLEMPREEEGKIIVDHATKEELQKELLKKMSKLKVHSVGDLVTDIIPGDMILIDPEALKSAKLIPISENKQVLLVSPFDIILVW